MPKLAFMSLPLQSENGLPVPFSLDELEDGFHLLSIGLSQKD